MEATKTAREFADIARYLQPSTDFRLLEELTQQIEEALQTGEIPLKNFQRTMDDLRFSPPDKPDLLTSILAPIIPGVAGQRETSEPPPY